MLSTRYKCICVRISKAASTSMLKAFKAKKRRILDGSFFSKKHYTIGYYRDTYPRQFNKYFKFAFVRNPWDRIYSQYRYQRYNKEFEIADCSFQEWLYKCEEALNTPDQFLFGRNRELFVHHLTDQLNWIALDGEIAVDFIGRFERLKADFEYVCERLNSKIVLQHHNVSKYHDDCKTAYDDSMIELVARWHSQDIEYFKYKF